MALRAKKTPRLASITDDLANAPAPTLTARARAEKAATEMERLNVDLDKDVYDAFHILSIKKKTKMAKLVRKWIEDYVRKHGNE